MTECRHFNLLRKRLRSFSHPYRRQYYCLDCGWKLTHKKCGGFRLKVKSRLMQRELIGLRYRYMRKNKISIWEKTFTETWNLIEPFEEGERRVWKSKNPLLTEARECARMQAYVELAEKLADTAWKPCVRDYWIKSEGYSGLQKIEYHTCKTCDPERKNTFIKCFKDHIKERIRKEQVSAPDKSKRISN